jgi:hypothetical protein
VQPANCSTAIWGDVTVIAERAEMIDRAFADYFCCPKSFAEFEFEPINRDTPEGFFRFGEDLVCYGRAAGGVAKTPDEPLPDLFAAVRFDGRQCVLSFDPTQVADSMRRERYVRLEREPVTKRLIRQAYYLLRPLLPVKLRRPLQARWLRGWQDKPFPQWPVDTSVDRLFTRLMRLKLQISGNRSIPFIWFWPEGHQACAVMTHDVETAAGLAFSEELMNINDRHGIKSSFQLIPAARYTVTDATVQGMRNRGFDVNVHDLKHDGHLFDYADQFQTAAAEINAHGVRFGSKGFRSGALYRNQEWYGALQFRYDMSVPNCAHLDPQRGGCCTVMPYFVGDVLEIPVTATQDYSLFHILKTYDQKLWHDQIARISALHGLISFIVHPDYLDHPEALEAYESLLKYLTDLRANSRLWIARPDEVDDWWRARHAMHLEKIGEGWKVRGDGAEHARIAYASLDGGHLVYTF